MYGAGLFSVTQAIQYPPDLPITARREEIIAALRTHRVVIVAGETGSGKTTQLPKMCIEAGLAENGRIGCTQPRRVAAMSVSRRVAEELQVTWGREVGCKIRFNDDTGRDTRVKFMTDGILLAEIQSDPMLRAYSTLIIDEAHERSLNIDFLLGYLQTLLKRRKDLRLVITSATIDTQAFSKAFDGAPIIEVSGRLFPVEIRYLPLESLEVDSETGSAGAEEGGYIEAAARMAEDVLIETDSGDVLIFMPTERDIRETRDLLEGSLGSGVEVLGLFGRMPSADQQRIFNPGPRRRVVVATNIAETSLTIPRIACVIDTGLARISRYNPRTRTKRLPIEPISQSGANQRTGRAGRVREGICIRLYSQEDFEKRPRFGQPEIQRANLAEVILRMKAFRLGEIETFPFLEPPLSQAIRAGYILLHELGALTEANELTAMGRELARLPVDPTLGRMLLQARVENVLPEMLVIAAGLSVPDPRERPEEAREAAATAHRAFADQASDFLTLLKIWRQAPPPDGASHNALRRFCKTHYLSIARMREWREIYRQLSDTLYEDPSPKSQGAKQEAGFDAIHRAILAGLLGQIALKEERNLYKAAGSRQVTVFPGSNLYERREKTAKAAPRKPGVPEPSRQPQWVVAGEIVQTSQLFARMLARIDPQWVVELGAHLCQFRYLEPHWSAKAGRVLVSERVMVHGLEIMRRKVDHGRINPAEATELFIRGALVAQEGQIPQRFFAENRKLREKIENALTRVRNGRVHDLDEAFYRFYAARIQDVSSTHDLNRFVNGRIGKEPDFLCATEADLIGSTEIAVNREMFPDRVTLDNAVLPLSYAYAPGTEEDGVTVRVPLPVAERLSDAELQWMIPGLRGEQISVLLRALPKTIRRQFMPLEPKVAEIASEFEPGKAGFLEALAAFLSRKYQITVKAEDWPPQSLPDYLRPRVTVVDRRSQTLAAGRDLEAVRGALEKSDLKSDAWEKTARRWEKPAISSWSFGDLPENVTVEVVGGAPLLGFPGLALRGDEVDVRFFRKREEVEREAPPAIQKLAELTLARDLAWLQKELRGLAAKWIPRDKPAAAFGAALDALSRSLQPTGRGAGETMNPDTLASSAYRHLVAHLFRLDPVLPLSQSRFQSMADAARREMPLLVRRVSELAQEILLLHRNLSSTTRRYSGLDVDLQRLVPSDFLARTPHGQLAHLPRYLRAMHTRGERASLSPAKDAEKAKQLAPFVRWEDRVPEPQRESFRWLLEEYRVSVFAQELGTAQPVSAQRLKALGNF